MANGHVLVRNMFDHTLSWIWLLKFHSTKKVGLNHMCSPVEQRIKNFWLFENQKMRMTAFSYFFWPKSFFGPNSKETNKKNLKWFYYTMSKLSVFFFVKCKIQEILNDHLYSIWHWWNSAYFFFKVIFAWTRNSIHLWVVRSEFLNEKVLLCRRAFQMSISLQNEWIDGNPIWWKFVNCIYHSNVN